MLNDLSERPFLWHFSVYGLNFSPQTSNLPQLGTSEYSVEELRLQAYAEARATGGSIDAYRAAVLGMKERAERAASTLIPNLLSVIRAARGNNVGAGSGSSAALMQQQQKLQQQLLHQHQTLSAPFGSSAHAPPATLTFPPPSIPTHQPAVLHPPLPSGGDTFAFGEIPETPPEGMK